VTGSLITFQNVWKKFHRGEMHDSLRDLLPALGRRVLGRTKPAGELAEGDFWALRDVSFEVRPGDALGIIGANGAGKSTVLKLLTRIVRPTRGSCGVQGRVGALIELAAGFHPDLTGRENVYLQGSIMGMHRPEIARKFDEIVAFAGVEDFIDTPVKRYSSGMHARLGFSIAAHLDPDVLIIDEVLSVGDVAFQRKAFGHIEEMRRRQIPLVVVSHQLDRITQLCTQALLLDKGRVLHVGPPGEAIGVYLGTTASLERPGRGDASIVIDSLDVNGVESVPSGGDVTLTVRGTVRDGRAAAHQAVHLRVYSAQTVEPVFSTNTKLCGVQLPSEGAFALDVKLQMNVPPMVYTIHARIWDTLTERDVHPGPRIQLLVTESAAFFGTVQLNPRLRLRTGASAAADPPAGPARAS
jgi:ABC-type polysaccharide/polyol phosphate transport system ATPase subunit